MDVCSVHISMLRGDLNNIELLVVFSEDWRAEANAECWRFRVRDHYGSV